MNAEAALLKACREWRRLAEAEGKAIRNRDWNFLLDCQTLIKELQPVMSRLLDEARAEWKFSGADFSSKTEKIRNLILELIELGSRNKSLLKAAREVVVLRRNEIERTRQNLKRLQQSYVLTRPARWVSFS